MTSALVSIGLFVYNGECFVETALYSIINQTFTDFELIVSDNASTDRTGEIVKAHARRDERIRYYRAEKNMGPGWNACRVYELAAGKYFKWAAADDYLEPDFLRQCVEILEQDPDCVVAYAGTKVIDGNGAFILNYVTPVKTDLNNPVARFREMLLKDHPCYQIYGLMRMSALRQIPPQGIYVNGDRVLLARMSLLGRFYEITEPLFISRRHSGQSVASLPARLRQSRFRLTNRRGVLPGLDWWDPTKSRAINFPEFRILREYFLSIYRVPLSGRQKAHCYCLLLLWIKIYHRKLVKDLMIAADQVLYNLQFAKTAQTDFSRKGELSLGRRLRIVARRCAHPLGRPPSSCSQAQRRE
jgi:glycosyltransferase involved in cell wall biosynthesis